MPKMTTPNIVSAHKEIGKAQFAADSAVSDLAWQIDELGGLSRLRALLGAADVNKVVRATALVDRASDLLIEAAQLLTESGSSPKITFKNPRHRRNSRR